MRTKKVPKKWRDGHCMGSEYALSAHASFFNFAPDTIIINLIFGTLLNAKPCIIIIVY